MADPRSSALAGIRVVEASLGVSVVGAGMASCLPGALLRDLGAEVTRVESAERFTLDAGVEYERAWNHGKRLERMAAEVAAPQVAGLAQEADVVFLVGDEAAIERQGIGVRQLIRANPRLVAVRIRPSFNALGPMPDLELLVAARAGLATQIRAHVPGRPAAPDLAVGQAGAALSATVGALAGLYERETTGTGRWAETSIYDGFQALLPMIIGRVEHHSPTTRLLWQQQGPAEALVYRCADGEYVQLWFGAKGAYEDFLAHIGDPPSEQGYNADMISGAMVERGQRWAARFATRDRSYWLEDLAGHNFRCEPALRPGEALLDGHVREVGLAVETDDPEHGRLTVLGPVIGVKPSVDGGFSPRTLGGPLLCGVRVLDLSAYLAGPVAPLVLAEMGADVVKVEPLEGDVHRSMEPMFAAGQRGKRAMAVNMKSPGAAEVMRRLFLWADVIHHNSRVGLAEHLGYDEESVRAANPDAVYSFSSGFGERGPRALLPTNDQLIQALAGIEQSQGGAGESPTFLVWGAVDTAGGWVSACGILAALYARRRTGRAQRVSTSLLGSGLTLKSGAFIVGDSVVGGPILDAGQLGFGAAYRFYQGADGRWLALAVPDLATWAALRRTVAIEGLPENPPPLRTAAGPPQAEEALLEKAFSSKDAGAWVAELRAAGVPVEPVIEADRETFVAGFVDDPVNRQLGRVVAHKWGERGTVEQTCFPPRFGPAPRPPAAARISGLGEHTTQILEALGFDDHARAELAASGVIPSAGGGAGGA
jgi:crotonobetainyl-CoA:carnitine CoA-transferase CaiB-like acyl-CoA transferase